jgi:hypothetical protein
MARLSLHAKCQSHRCKYHEFFGSSGVADLRYVIPMSTFRDEWRHIKFPRALPEPLRPGTKIEEVEMDLFWSSGCGFGRDLAASGGVVDSLGALRLGVNRGRVARGRPEALGSPVCRSTKYVYET